MVIVVRGSTNAIDESLAFGQSQRQLGRQTSKDVRCDTHVPRENKEASQSSPGVIGKVVAEKKEKRMSNTFTNVK